MKPTYEQWAPLVTKVVTERFWWVYEDSASDANRRLQRSVCRDDMLQEGNLALLDAIDGYNPDHPSGAQFKTYAYKTIYRRVKDYIRDNQSVIKTCRPEDAAASTNTQLIERYQAATNYSTFGDLRPNRRDVDELPFAPTPPKDKMWQDSPDIALEAVDFTEHCIKRLRQHITGEQMNILLARYDGKTWGQIGRHYGRGHEWARRKAASAMEIARRILRREAAELAE